ncbi:hypothetical protein HU200_052915 [Digitaria exilis]|uniref:Uncharacterized protein n=1 Tax=Digitaria exilis TaxID=1010633 RepID=A0A835E5C3_9POAL|nr:hypothetical protein HU200_052915 [Digitaria exilis]
MSQVAWPVFAIFIPVMVLILAQLPPLFPSPRWPISSSPSPTRPPPLSLSDQWARVVILSSSLPRSVTEPWTPLVIPELSPSPSGTQQSPTLRRRSCSFSSPYKIRASSLPYPLGLALPLLPAQRRRQVELADDELQEPPLSSIRSDRRQRMQMDAAMMVPSPSRIDLSGHRRRSFAGGARRREGRSRRRHDSDSDRLPPLQVPLVLLFVFPHSSAALGRPIAGEPSGRAAPPPWRRAPPSPSFSSDHRRHDESQPHSIEQEVGGTPEASAWFRSYSSADGERKSERWVAAGRAPGAGRRRGMVTNRWKLILSVSAWLVTG